MRASDLIDQENEDDNEDGQRPEKGKGRAMDEEDQDEEGEDNDKDDEEYREEEEEDDDDMGVTTASFDPLSTLCNKAVISICRINVFDPPAPIVFGTWNQREMKESEAKILANEMMSTKFSPFASGNLLPLIIRRDGLDPTCFITDLNAENAPLLQLSQQAKKEGKTLCFAGGRHRQRATAIIQERSKAKIANLEEKVSNMREQMQENVREGMEKKLREMERDHVAEKEFYERLGLWGVIAYDAGE
jgi:hypothetical protein